MSTWAGRALGQWGQLESSLAAPPVPTLLLFSLPAERRQVEGDTPPHSPGSSPTFPSQGSRGELLLSLCYNPSANSIIVNIIKARNLKAMDIGGTSGAGASRQECGRDREGSGNMTVMPDVESRV